eukprot:IDg3911t1
MDAGQDTESFLRNARISANVLYHACFQVLTKHQAVSQQCQKPSVSYCQRHVTVLASPSGAINEFKAKNERRKGDRASGSGPSRIVVAATDAKLITNSPVDSLSEQQFGSGQDREDAEQEIYLHRQLANQEYSYYNKVRRRQATGPQNGNLHLMFDSAEKVLLPSMERQPGNLQFVTGLEYDLFAISNSNDAETTVFGLAEGHWPGSKCPDAVL